MGAARITVQAAPTRQSACAYQHQMRGAATREVTNDEARRGMVSEPPLSGESKLLEPCNAKPPLQRQFCPLCPASAACGDNSPAHCKPRTRRANHAFCANGLLYGSGLVLGVGWCWDRWCRQASRGRRAQRQGLMQLHGLKRRDLFGCRRAGPCMSISWQPVQGKLHASQDLREVRTGSSSFPRASPS